MNERGRACCKSVCWPQFSLYFYLGVRPFLAALPLYADSDEVAWAFRDDVARDYEMISLGFGASLA
jgi:hypothetical protein